MRVEGHVRVRCVLSGPDHDDNSGGGLQRTIEVTLPLSVDDAAAILNNATVRRGEDVSAGGLVVASLMIVTGPSLQAFG